MKIIVDSRELKQRIDNFSNYLKKQEEEYNYSIQRLDVADYVFINIKNNKKITFEYKTVADLISSIQNGSVFEEIINQANQYEYTYLIIVGNIQKELKGLYYKRKVKASLNKFIKSNIKMIDGAIDRIMSLMIPVIIVESEDLAFKKMLDISNKVFEDKLFILGRKRSIRSSKNPALIYLSGVKNLNIKTAELVTTKLDINCLQDLLNIKKEDLLKIKGIGNKKAEIILKAIYGEVKNGKNN